MIGNPRGSSWMRVIFMLLVLVATGIALYRPGNMGRAAPAAPEWTITYYVETLEEWRLDSMGYSQGVRSATRGPESGVVILAFGQPLYANGYYTVNAYGAGYPTRDKIAALVRAFAAGYYRATGHYASNRKIRIAVGTSNYEGQQGLGEVYYGHGYWWGGTVAAAAQAVRDGGYSTRVTVSGANDIEMNWSSPYHAQDWLNGWAFTAVNVLYNFGDAAGCYGQGDNYRCNPSDFPSWIGETPSGYDRYGDPYYGRFWNIDDVSNVSGLFKAGGGYPIPQIYQYNSEGRWARISYDAHYRKGSRLTFAGSLTGWCRSYSGCEGGNPNPGSYAPWEGWANLYDAINSRWETAHSIGWSTDIRETDQ